MANRTGCRGLDRLAEDARVLDIYREGGVGDTRWLYTMVVVRGWQADGCHFLVEDSVAELRQAFRNLRPCVCAECRDEG